MGNANTVHLTAGITTSSATNVASFPWFDCLMVILRGYSGSRRASCGSSVTTLADSHHCFVFRRSCGGSADPSHEVDPSGVGARPTGAAPQRRDGRLTSAA